MVLVPKDKKDTKTPKSESKSSGQKATPSQPKKSGSKSGSSTASKGIGSSGPKPLKLQGGKFVPNPDYRASGSQKKSDANSKTSNLPWQTGDTFNFAVYRPDNSVKPPNGSWDSGQKFIGPPVPNSTPKPKPATPPSFSANTIQVFRPLAALHRI